MKNKQEMITVNIPALGESFLFLKAMEEDKNRILCLYKSQLGEPCCPWDAEYPGMPEIEGDLKEGNLYILKTESGELLAAISLDKEKEIEELDCWAKNLQPSCGLSRLAVARSRQNCGIAGKMIQCAMEVLKSRGCRSVHFLVNKTNEKAIRAYDPLHFNRVGSCRMFEQDFLCYEKELDGFSG